jgi:polysaccharide biosynthesis transport protein
MEERNMSPDVGSSTVETNVLASILNHRLLVLACVVVFAGIGVAVSSLRPTEYTAEASVLLQEPSPTASLEARDEARYVADQVAVMKSLPIALRASDIARDGEPPINLDGHEFQRRALITATEESNFVSVSFRAGNPDAAATGANSIVQAYEETASAKIEAEAKQELEKIDAEIAAATEQASEAGGVLTPEDTAAYIARLKAERARIATNAAATDDAVAAFYPADPGRRHGPSRLSILALSVVLGALIGCGVAYWRGARRREFFDKFEPGAVLAAPLLAVIPNFIRESAGSTLPALTSGDTKAAREFRFLSSSVAAAGPRADVGDRASPLVGFVAASRGDGTTTIVANTALAAAQEGYAVLALDADGGTRALTHRLLSETGTPTSGNGRTIGQPGNTALPESAIMRSAIATDGGGAVSLLEWGPAGSASQLDAVRRRFDLLVADLPPMLDGARAHALVSVVDRVFVVVPHRGTHLDLKELLDRLDLLGVRPAGYVYNMRPSRRKRGWARRLPDLTRPRSVAVAPGGPRRTGIAGLKRLARWS